MDYKKLVRVADSLQNKRPVKDSKRRARHVKDSFDPIDAEDMVSEIVDDLGADSFDVDHDGHVQVYVGDADVDELINALSEAFDAEFKAEEVAGDMCVTGYITLEDFNPDDYEDPEDE